MSKCIINQGEKWCDCPNHKNMNGEHGDYLCIHIYEKKGDGLYATQRCRLMDFEIEEDLFLL